MLVTLDIVAFPACTSPVALIAVNVPDAVQKWVVFSPLELSLLTRISPVRYVPRTGSAETRFISPLYVLDELSVEALATLSNDKTENDLSLNLPPGEAI